MSMKPGARTRPLASMTGSSFFGLKSPTLTMRSPEMRTLTLRKGAPVPSATWPLMMTVEADFSCELAKTHAKARAKNRRINLSWEMQNIDVPRKEFNVPRFAPHLYTNEERIGKRRLANSLFRDCRESLLRQFFCAGLASQNEICPFYPDMR